LQTQVIYNLGSISCPKSYCIQIHTKGAKYDGIYVIVNCWLSSSQIIQLHGVVKNGLAVHYYANV